MNAYRKQCYFNPDDEYQRIDETVKLYRRRRSKFSELVPNPFA